jgi:protein O-mannosyl-transferase
MSRQHQHLLILAILVGAVVITFGPAFDATFLNWDDDHNIYENPHIRKLDGPSIKWMFTDLGGDIRYKPLGYLSWALLYAGFGLNPQAYHTANIVLHGLNACLLYLVLRQFRRILPAEFVADQEPESPFLPAVVAAAFWALHPLRVEPVAWACVLPYHLSITFLLLSLHRYFAVDTQKPFLRQPAYWQALAAFFLSLLSFPISIGCIALFLGLAIWPLRQIDISNWTNCRNRRSLTAWLGQSPFWAAAGVAMLIALYGALVRVGHFDPPPTLEEFPVPNRLLQGAYLLCLYALRVFLPWDLRPYYTDLIDFSPVDPRFIISALILLAVVVLAFKWRRRRPWLAALLIAHVGILLPVLGLTSSPHHPSDRHTIAHGILIALGMTAALAAIRNPILRQRSCLAFCLATSVFAIMSRGMCDRWLNELSFFSQLAAELPEGGVRANALMKHGNALARERRYEEAIASYRRARKSAPNFPLAQLPFREGEAYLALNQVDRAIESFRQALLLEPDQTEMWAMLAELLAATGRRTEAISLLQEAIRQHPGVAIFPHLLTKLRP